MPYKIKKSGSGYKVSSPGKTYSKKPMSKEKASRQLAAIKMHTNEAAAVGELEWKPEYPGRPTPVIATAHGGHYEAFPDRWSFWPDALEDEKLAYGEASSLEDAQAQALDHYRQSIEQRKGTHGGQLDRPPEFGFRRRAQREPPQDAYGWEMPTPKRSLANSVERPVPRLTEVFGEAVKVPPHKTGLAPDPDPEHYLLFQSQHGYHMLTPDGNEQWFQTPEHREKYLRWHWGLTHPGQGEPPTREVQPRMSEVFRVGEAQIQNRPPPGSKQINPVDYNKMGQMGQSLKQNLTAMQTAGSEYNAYATPAGDRMAFPKDAAPGRPPLKADTTKGVWTPVTGSSPQGTTTPSVSPTTTTTK